jgi:hypothetical protein
MCEGVCTDHQTDPLHCGECGTACGLGETCVDGMCTVVCGPESTDCGGSCVDTDTSIEHCGACDSPCPEGEVCVDGSCELVCGGTTETLCGDACVDLMRNPLHCGACDNACAAGEICSSGTCILSCGGSTPTRCGDACVDTDANPLHCGECDNACASGEVCDAGSCVLTCSPGLTECSGACFDLDTAPDHCGDCDTACASPANATGVCLAGSCGIVCTGTYLDCNRDPDDGCEIAVDDLQSDRGNCGGCGVACTTEEMCLVGSCILPETCAQYVPLTTTDGTFTLYWDGDPTMPWDAWCQDMAGTPLEYLDLVATATGQNFSQYSCGGWATGTNVRTVFTRVRVDVANEEIDIGDGTFSTSAGSCVQGSTTITSMTYGTASDCIAGYSEAGGANVDLTGTHFRVDDTWCLAGHNAAGTAVLSSGDQIVDVTGGGSCGTNLPCGTGLDLQYVP